MHGPIQALLELAEKIIHDAPNDADLDNILTESNIHLLLNPPASPASQIDLHGGQFPTTHDVRRIHHLLHNASNQHLLAHQLGPEPSNLSLRDSLTPIELSRVDQATYARLQILKRQSASVPETLTHRASTTAASYKTLQTIMNSFVKTAGIAAVLDETAKESLISLLWDDLVGVEDALNLLEVEEAKRCAGILGVKLEAVLVRVLFNGFEEAGLREGQFRWVVEMRALGREVGGLMR